MHYAETKPGQLPISSQFNQKKKQKIQQKKTEKT